MRTTVLMIMFGCLVTAANAQWKISALAGPSFATFGGKDAETWGGSNPGLVVRYHVGGLLIRPVNEKLTANGGLLVATKGTSYNAATDEDSAKERLTYIDLPVFLEYHPLDKIGVMFGLQPSLLAGARIKYNDGYTESVKEDYKSFDIAFLVGPRYYINEKFGVQLMYSHGLPKTARYESKTYAVSNRELKLSVTYAIKELK